MEKNYPNQIMLMGIFMKFSDLWDVKIEKNIHQKKNNHTQDSIYMVRQFVYVHRIAEISLFLRKKYKMR